MDKVCLLHFCLNFSCTTFFRFGLGGEYIPRKLLSSFIKNPSDDKIVHVLDRSLPHDELYKALNVFLKKIIVK